MEPENLFIPVRVNEGKGVLLCKICALNCANIDSNITLWAIHGLSSPLALTPEQKICTQATSDRIGLHEDNRWILAQLTDI